MTQIIRKIIYLALDLFIFIRTFLGFTRSGIVVLIYHNVEKSESEAFRQQMQFIKSRYNFISFTEFESLITSGRKIQGLNILVTFDDGFKSNKRVADEILDSIGVKAMLFIPAFLVSKTLTNEVRQKFITQNLKEPPMDEEFVTITDLKDLIKNGHTVGAHGYNHFRLSTLTSDEEREIEVISAAAEISEKLDYDVEAMAYPFGGIQYIDQRSLEISNRAYKFVFSGVRGANTHRTHPLTIRRDTVTPKLSNKDLRRVIEGGLSALYFFKRRKLDSMIKNVSSSPKY